MRNNYSGQKKIRGEKNAKKAKRNRQRLNGENLGRCNYHLAAFDTNTLKRHLPR